MKRKLSPKGLAWGGVILLAAGALVVLAVVAVRQGWLAVLLDKDALQGFVARFGVWGPLVFIALQMAQVVVSFIPGNVT
ncbi:MAG: hypothetical protein LBT60_03960, partial [Oscillospiraceae bacterium]|nr:hypothetical protein [Oscillospiraceae bacterium]